MDANLPPTPKPNRWVTRVEDSASQLTYALQIEPAPLTVSLPNEDPVLAALLFVITNGQASAVEVTSIAFTFQVGDDAVSLTASPSNSILYTVSDPTDWQMTPPPSPVSSGPATFTLGPVTGSSVTLAAGASVTVQFFQIAVNEAVGTTLVKVKEIIGSQVDFTTFEVTKFPYGFYFNGLIATVPSGSTNVPVAQVAYNTPVTLLWNGSVMDASAYTVYYATNEGQQTDTVTTPGQWSSPPLTCDTVFTVVVKATSVGGQPVTVALSTEVSVQQPDVVAGSVSAASANVSGALSAGSLAAGGVTISEGGAVLVLNTGSLAVEGQTSLNNATVDGPVAVYGNTLLDGQLTLNGSAVINDDSTLNGVLRGNSNIGGGAARIGGYGTASDAVFAFKYDDRNFGNSSNAIQVWNESSGVYKTFIVDHPLDRGKYLVHATLEGPEAAVFYRGSGRLESGRAEVELPPYFEPLTHPESWTIQLTNVGGFDRLAVQPAGERKINGGRFVVVSDNPASTQAFDWEVKGTRRDQPRLEVEPARREILVHSFGPYAFAVRRPRAGESD